MKAILMLEDGKMFGARASGAAGERLGQVCFNTAVVGYQEMLTDPANAAKILVLTYPLIGNYGIAPKFNESGSCWPAALGIKERSAIYSNWQARESLDDFAKREKLMVLEGLDTRGLIVHLRNKGEMLGIASTEDGDPKSLLSKMAAYKNSKPQSFVARASVSRPKTIGSGKKKIAVLDLGVTNSLIKQLTSLGAGITLLPYNTAAKDILKTKTKGLIISNGAEQDIALEEVIENIKSLIGKLSILGISTGHQALAAAAGAKVIRMKLGHRGVNYPIRNPASYKGQISVQNHGYVVDANSLTKIKGLKITGYNFNDMSVEEIENKRHRYMGIQYYPVSPGFNETHPVLRRFLNMATSR